MANPSQGEERTRALQLLWRHGGEEDAGPGPSRGLSVDHIVHRAIALADAEGLEALSMRSLARAAGVAPMTLYTYVSGRAILVDLMLDAVHGEVGSVGNDDAPWRSRVAAVADANRALFRRHPWAASVYTARPPLGPGTMAKYEQELLALEGLGLDDIEMDAALTLVVDFVRAVCAAEEVTRRAALDSGETDQEWWAASQPVLQQILDADRYPTASRVGAAAGTAHDSAYDADHAYRFGLARILDGLAAIIDRNPVAP